MLGVFGLTLWMGHLTLILLVILLQCKMFSELATVRYKAHKAREVPMFRTIQWCWFGAALFITYSLELLKWMSQFDMSLSKLKKLPTWLSFGLYSLLFVI